MTDYNDRHAQGQPATEEWSAGYKAGADDALARQSADATADLAAKWRTEAEKYKRAADEAYEAGYYNEGDMNDVNATVLRECAAELSHLRFPAETTGKDRSWKLEADAYEADCARLEKENAQLRTQVEILRKGIQDFLDGDYDHPRAHRPGKCRHGLYYYNACESCDEEHFINVMKAFRSAVTSTDGAKA
jgi:cell division protein FtsB